VILLAFTFLDPANRAFAHQKIPLELAGCSFDEDGDDWFVSTADGAPKKHELHVSPRTLNWEPWDRLALA